MIKGLMGGNGVVVDGGNTVLPYVPMNNENPIQGMIRVWGTDLQVFNGSNWTQLQASYATVRLDPNSESLLAWCNAQRTMAMRRLELAEKNPALMNALEAIKKAEDNYEILAKFVEHDGSQL